MRIPAPHFVLRSSAVSAPRRPQWRFDVRQADGPTSYAVQDHEPGAAGERLELLAVVRGLESLDQPSTVTLLTASRYVRQGVEYGLDEWRRNGWRWESYGQWVPVKNADLWQRIDRALAFHRVEFRKWRFDSAHLDAAHVATPSTECQAPTTPRRSRAEPTDHVSAPANHETRRGSWLGRAARFWGNLRQFCGFWLDGWSPQPRLG